MASSYLQGGDAYQKLDYPIMAGQTFRVDQPFILHWIDLNLKLAGQKPEALVSLYHAGPDHLPSGDPISISRHWLINPPFAPTDWHWHEPWGKTLRENHPWKFLNPPPNIHYTLKNGVITLTNYGYSDIGINFNPLVNFPLINEAGRQQHLALNTPHVTTDRYATIIGLGGYFHHPLDGVMHFAFYIALGAAWYDGGQYGVDPGPPWPRGWKYIGAGQHNINLYDYWHQWRTDLGLPLDPTDWSITGFHLAMITSIPSSVDHLQNDYIGCYYPPYPSAPPPGPSKGYTWPNRLYRVRFSMQDVLLTPDQYYFIRVTAFPGLLEGAHHWQYDKDDSTYPQGIRSSTDDGGATWTKHFDDDHLFAAFGTPPSPDPPPDPPLPNWCILRVIQTQTLTGYKIVVWTNVPCHLFMFWTPTEPEKHMRTRILRGVSILDTPAYCFVTWHENEQLEPGDTIIHTFIKEPWPVCETRWYTFRALVNNEWSPSAGPIFKKHRPELPYGDPVWIECPLKQAPIGGWAKDTDFYTLQTKDPGSWDWTVSEYIALTYPPPTYWLWRSGIVWDTTLIPAGSMILQAYMHRYGYYPIIGGDVDFDYIWLNAVNWPGTVNPADYALFNSFRQIVAQYRVFPSWDTRAWHDIPLNADGLAAIVPAGLTKMCSQCDIDYSDNPPPAMEVRRFLWYGLDVGNPQKLFVQYMPPL